MRTRSVVMSPLMKTWKRPSTSSNQHYVRTLAIITHGKFFVDVDIHYWLIYDIRYGLGTCYLRMSKIRLAEYHYRKAVEIHPKNAVLLGCVGMVCSKSYAALVVFRRRGVNASALFLFPRLSKDVVIEMGLSSSSTKPSNLLLRMLWSVIGERKFSSQCGNIK